MAGGYRMAVDWFVSSDWSGSPSSDVVPQFGGPPYGLELRETTIYCFKINRLVEFRIAYSIQHNHRLGLVNTPTTRILGPPHPRGGKSH